MGNYYRIQPPQVSSTQKGQAAHLDVVLVPDVTIGHQPHTEESSSLFHDLSGALNDFCDAVLHLVKYYEGYGSFFVKKGSMLYNLSRPSLVRFVSKKAGDR